MNTIIKKMLVFVIAAAIICTNCVFSIYAQSIVNDDTAEYVIPNDAVYSDSEVIVVLNKEESLKLKTYSVNSFSRLNISSVEELSTSKTEKVQSTFNSIMSKTNNQEDVRSLQNNYYRIFCLELNEPSHDNIKETIKVLNGMDGILCAIPNFEIKIEEDEISSIISNTTNYNEPSTIYNKIGLNNVWSTVTQQNTVRVAVIDTGIDEQHSAFGGIYNSIIDESSCAHIENTTYDTGTIPFDPHGHGTHVAGIIAGAYNSQLGFRGVCSNVELIAVRIFDESGTGDLCDLVKAMNYLNGLSNPVDIINISAGFLDRFYELDVQEELADAIFGGNSLVVCAAGNDNEELIPNGMFPGGLNPTNNQTDKLITVGASTFNDTIWVNNSTGQGSNYGESTVDLFAPGELIVSCVPNGYGARYCLGDNCTSSGHVANGYHALTGTSMATPFVTGVAALMLSVVPNLTADDIASVFRDPENVDSGTSSAFEGKCVSEGRLNALKAIEAAYELCHHTDADTYFSHTSTMHKLCCSICDAVISTEAHGFTYTSINVDRHRAYCAECSYSVTEDHDLYIYSVYNDVYTIKCRECSYSISCNCDREYVDDGASGHYVDCLDGCFSEFEPHTYELTGTYNSSGHEIECVYCYYSDYIDHDLYMYSAAPEDYVVKCHDCSYTVECWESPEYYGNSSDGHWVDCPCGCYSFFEPHTPGSYYNTEEGYHEIECADCGYVYTEDCNFGDAEIGNSYYHFYECVDCGYETAEAHSFVCSGIGDLYNHTLECSVCGETDTESHDWIRVGTKYRCLVCGRQETIIPTDVMSLSEEELELLLSSMSEEELDQFIALLPEDAIARVTAILAPVKDDERLTE